MAKRKKLQFGNTVSYQNKDITSKIFGEGMKEKSLSVYGISVPRIIDVLPTNLPAIEANELRMDNLFRLADGSYALIDYESQYRSIDKLKYLSYIVRTAKRLYHSGIRNPHIRMIVLYTSNVTKAGTDLNLGCLRFQLEAGYLVHINTDQVLEALQNKIKNSELLTDEEMMQLIILPLTVGEAAARQDLLKTAVHLAKELTDEFQQIFALSGIVTFSDKIIDTDYAENIRRWIQMTKVGRLFEIEKEEAVKKAVQDMQKQLALEKRKNRNAESKIKTAENKARNAESKIKTIENKAKTAELKVCILQMLLKGNTISDTAEKLHMKPSDVAALISEQEL